MEEAVRSELRFVQGGDEEPLIDLFPILRHKLDEAQAAIKDALRLGTRDAKLFYHAGMIARARGDAASARDYLQRALKLNPQFDPLQAAIAAKALAE